MMENTVSEISKKIKEEEAEALITISERMNDTPRLIAKLKAVNMSIANNEKILKEKKLEYETEYIELCTSKEYEHKYKTIKAREQKATLMLTSRKAEINELENIRLNLKLTKEGLQYELALAGVVI